MFRTAPWREPLVLDAANSLRGALGVSRSLWAEACQSMGHDEAVLAIAIVSTKSAAHFSRSAGGYFARMVRKHHAQPMGAARGQVGQGVPHHSVSRSNVRGAYCISKIPRSR